MQTPAIWDEHDKICTDSDGYNIDNLFEAIISGEAGQEVGHVFPYEELLGSLHYKSTHTRADITFEANVLSRFKESNLQVHWSTAKNVLRYLAGTRDHGIMIEDVQGEVNG